MMRKVFQTRTPAVIGSLPAILEGVARAAAAEGLDSQKAGSVELATEEAVTNVCKYSGPADIELACLADDAAFLVEISDAGKPFDPTSAPDPDLTLGVEERPIGGLGVFLIKRLTDTLHYERRDGRNVLRLEFHKPGAA
jgi:anti-sigma regulatory factor (Ser/Thr protein kinase)